MVFFFNLNDDFKMFLNSDPVFLVVFDGKVGRIIQSSNIGYRKLKILTVYLKNLCYLYILPIQKYKNHLKNKVAGKWTFYIFPVGVYITRMFLESNLEKCTKTQKGEKSKCPLIGECIMAYSYVSTPLKCKQSSERINSMKANEALSHFSVSQLKRHLPMALARDIEQA